MTKKNDFDDTFHNEIDETVHIPLEQEIKIKKMLALLTPDKTISVRTERNGNGVVVMETNDVPGLDHEKLFKALEPLIRDDSLKDRKTRIVCSEEAFKAVSLGAYLQKRHYEPTKPNQKKEPAASEEPYRNTVEEDIELLAAALSALEYENKGSITITPKAVSIDLTNSSALSTHGMKDLLKDVVKDASLITMDNKKITVLTSQLIDVEGFVEKLVPGLKVKFEEVADKAKAASLQTAAQANDGTVKANKIDMDTKKQQLAGTLTSLASEGKLDPMGQNAIIINCGNRNSALSHKSYFVGIVEGVAIFQGTKVYVPKPALINANLPGIDVENLLEISAKAQGKSGGSQGRF